MNLTVDESYGVLLEAITRGVYRARVTIEGLPLTIRALPESEASVIREELQDLEIPVINDAILALSLERAADIDLRVLSYQERREVIARLNEVLAAGSIDKIVSMQFDAQHRLGAACEYLEGFCHTKVSRAMWKSRRGYDILSPRFTGIQLPETYAYYDAQVYWKTFNEMRDSYDEQVRQLDGQYLLLSGLVGGKEVRKLQTKNEEMQQQREEEAADLVRFGNRYKVAEHYSKPTDDGWARSLDTKDSIVAEIDRMLRGEKDKHDLFMEEHRRRMQESRKREVEEVKQSEAQARKSREAFEKVADNLTTRMVKVQTGSSTGSRARKVIR